MHLVRSAAQIPAQEGEQELVIPQETDHLDISLTSGEKVNNFVDHEAQVLRMFDKDENLLAEVPLPSIKANKDLTLFSTELITTPRENIPFEEYTFEGCLPTPIGGSKFMDSFLFKTIVLSNRDGIFELSYKSTSNTTEMYIQLLKNKIINYNYHSRKNAQNVPFVIGCFHTRSALLFMDLVMENFESGRFINRLDTEALEKLINSELEYIGFSIPELFVKILKSSRPDLLLDNINKFFPPREALSVADWEWENQVEIKDILEDQETTLQQKIEEVEEYC